MSCINPTHSSNCDGDCYGCDNPRLNSSAGRRAQRTRDSEKARKRKREAEMRNVCRNLSHGFGCTKGCSEDQDPDDGGFRGGP